MIVFQQVADSVAGSAITRALSASAQINWKIGATIVAGLLFAVIMFLVVTELIAIQRAGGFKAWVRDVPLIPYRTVRMQYISEGCVIILTFICIAHAIWPQIVGEVQIQLVYGLFAFNAASIGLNVTAFNIDAKNQPDASQIAARAAADDPLSMPLVRMNTRTGETTVEAVQAPAPREYAVAAQPAAVVAPPTPLVKKPLTFVADD